MAYTDFINILDVTNGKVRINPNAISLLINCGVSSTTGYAMTRSIPHAAIACAVTIVDEVAIHLDLATKHYFSSFALYFTIFSKTSIPYTGDINNVIRSSIIVSFSTALSIYSNDLLPLNMIINETTNSLEIIGSILGNIEDSSNTYKYSEFLKDYSVKFGINVLNVIAGIYINSQLNLGYAKLGKIIFRNKDTISGTQGGNHEHIILFLNTCLKQLGYFLALSGTTFINIHIQNIYDILITKEIEQSITKTLIKDENSLKLMNDEMGRNVIETVYSDFQNIYSGTKKINSYSSDIASGIYGINKLSSISYEALLCNLLSNLFFNYARDIINNHHKDIKEKLLEQESTKAFIKSNIMDNILQITLMDGEGFIGSKLNAYDTEISQLKANENFWKELIDFYETSRYSADYLIFQFMAGILIYNGKMETDEVFNFTDYLSGVNAILSIKSKFKKESKDLLISLDRITKFNELIAQEAVNVAHYTVNSDGKLKINNLTIDINSSLLISIEHLELELGKCYAVTGSPGVGKTITFKKIKGIKNDGIDIQGTVSKPLDNEQAINISMLPQQVYLPSNSTLLEILNFPKIYASSIDNKKLVEKLKKMLQELAVDDPQSSNSILNILEEPGIAWSKILSGGQKKKISLISKVLNSPKILFLDEPFNEFDSYSTILAQKFLKKYLPDTLLIIVDHHAVNNNFNKFYDSELYVFNKTIIERNISSKAIEDELYILKPQSISTCVIDEGLFTLHSQEPNDTCSLEEDTLVSPTDVEYE